MRTIFAVVALALCAATTQARETALHRAVMSRDKVAIADALRREPRSVNVGMEAFCGQSNYHGGSGRRDCQSGVTPLMLAAILGDLEAVTLLLDGGASARAISSRGWTAADFVMQMVPWQDLRVLELLIERGDPRKRLEFGDQYLRQTMPTFCSPVRSDKIVAQFVFLARLDPAGFHRPPGMSDECHAAALDALAGRPQKPNASRFMSAIEGASIERVESEIARGIDVNSRDASGRTALYLATARIQPEIVARLIAAGADVNARNEVSAKGSQNSTQPDGAGLTPLMAIARDPVCNAVLDDDWPSACKSRVLIAARLVQAGARADATDQEGRPVGDQIPRPDSLAGARYQARLRDVLTGGPIESFPNLSRRAPQVQQPVPVPLTPEARIRRGDAAIFVAPSAGSTAPGRSNVSGSSVYGSGMLSAPPPPPK